MYQFEDDPRNKNPQDMMTPHKTIPYYDMEELKQFPFSSHLCFDYKKEEQDSMKSTFTVNWANVIIYAFIGLITVAFVVFGYFVAEAIWDKILN